MVFKEAGAVKKKAASLQSSMCVIGSAKVSVRTGFSETTSRLRGETKRAADSVNTTRTPTEAALKARTSSGALYAAILPVTPKII
jgi:hypothetical protein